MLKTETERWIGGREREKEEEEDEHVLCMFTFSLFVFFFVCFRRHTRIEAPLYNWIKLNRKPKGTRTREEQKSKKIKVAVTPSSLNKLG